ncbi:short transient receptor potential channel 2-like [Hypanus sabinus]|uniref:short transient receptor potential channel 2-like n=1 Tax=Hypanus sabinus TaxID=79690 RepID=UPI0028C39EA1|nr:short transient receptor potential channel 2-like [Hypanus sabinus]
MEHLTEDNWREIAGKKMKFPPSLIGAIYDGNLAKIYKLLQTSDGILRQLDDAEDRSWREALNLAIRMSNEEIIVALLRCVKFDFRQIHEALLVAVDMNLINVVKLLLERLDQQKGVSHNKVDIMSFSLALFDHSIDSSRFAPGVTPLTLACQKNLFEIVDLLMKKGHVIPTPHKISCACPECLNARQYDMLKFSLSRMNTYKGLASRPYLSIANDDAMLSAFKLSRELKQLSKKEPEFKPEYLNLEELCQDLAVELLGMCRNQSEVNAILNDSGEDQVEKDDMDNQAFEEGIPNLGRLRLAVNYNQKRVNSGAGGTQAEGREAYRLQVIKTLVQRYIETSRQEFAEKQRKDLGNRITELSKFVGRLQSEIKRLRYGMGAAESGTKSGDASTVISKYILGARNRFQEPEDGSEPGSRKASFKVTVHQDSDDGAEPPGACKPVAEEGDEDDDEGCPPYPSGEDEENPSARQKRGDAEQAEEKD